MCSHIYLDALQRDARVNQPITFLQVNWKQVCDCSEEITRDVEPERTNAPWENKLPCFQFSALLRINIYCETSVINHEVLQMQNILILLCRTTMEYTILFPYHFTLIFLCDLKDTDRIATVTVGIFRCKNRWFTTWFDMYISMNFVKRRGLFAPKQPRFPPPLV